MKARLWVLAGSMLILCSGAGMAQVSPAPAPLVPAGAVSALSSAVPIVPSPPLTPPLTPEALLSAEATLSAAHAAWVKRTIPVDAALQDQWRAWAQTTWGPSGRIITEDQAVVVVNRNSKAEQIAVMVAHPSAPWTLIGVSPTSTGQSGRLKHFITPLGVFDHDGSIMDYRAQGTKNENGIRGIGAKGSRVWDFGWQQAQPGWIKHPEIREMRLEMHATDPDILEQRLGHPASEGCVRIGAGLNKFLDHFGIMDAAYWVRAPESVALRALLPKNAQPTLVGQSLIVVDIAPPPPMPAATLPIVPPVSLSLEGSP